MFKQILSGLIAMMAVVPAMAIPKPYLIGEARVEENFMILRERIVCNAFMAPVDIKKRVDPKDLIYPEWSVGLAEAGKTNVMADGKLDGDLITITGDLKDGHFNISVQEGGVEAGQLAAYSSSASGTLTEQKSVGLSYSRKGKYGYVGCAYRK